ncbi:helix-turn-helix domain-containing protein [Actinoplanes sp. CA-131856]
MAHETQGGNGGTELGRFLRARRAQVTPEHAGIGVGPGWRRTPGLRREELAALAGVSVDYYIRLERGKEHRPSPAVIDALAAALGLDAHERRHLFDIAMQSFSATPTSMVQPDRHRTALGTDLLLERLRPYPARVLSRTLDLLACNPGGLRTLPGIEEWPAERRNVARYMFLHPAARDLFRDWNTLASGCVARLRAVGGREPHAPDVAELVAELADASSDFAWLWDRYEVRPFTGTTKVLNHPRVGTISLRIQAMQVEGTVGHRLVTYFAEPGTPDHDALVLLDR